MLCSFWTLALDRFVSIGGSCGTWLTLGVKVLADQTLFSLYMNSAFVVLTESMQRRPLRASLAKARAAAWPCLTAGWRFWPAAHALTYSIVPLHLRV